MYNILFDVVSLIPFSKPAKTFTQSRRRAVAIIPLQCFRE